MQIEIVIPVSTEQEDLIFDHVFADKELSMFEDEKIWMLMHARKLHENCKILSANLNIAKMEWILQIDTA